VNILRNRWMVLTMALICSATMGILYSWSVFVAPLETMFGWNRSQTGFTFSLIMVFMGLGMFTGGMLVQKLGPVVTESIGGSLLGVGFFLASYTTSLIWLYVTYGAIAGYGLGMANVVPISTALRWFPDKKGLVSGLVTMFLALGTFVLGSKLSPSLIKTYDVTTAFKVLGIVFLVVTLVSAQFFRFPESVPGAVSGAKTQTIWGAPTNEMLKTGTAWTIVIWGMSIQIGGLLIIGHIVPYAQSQGLELSQALVAMTVYAFGNGLGRLFHGWLHDAAGRRVSMSVNALLMLTGLLGLRFLPGSMGYTGLLLAVIPVSMAYGGAVAHFAVLIATFFGPKYFSANYGFYTFPGVIAALIGPPLGGFVYDSSGSYQTAIMVAAGISIIGVIAAQMVKNPQLKPEYQPVAPAD